MDNVINFHRKCDHEWLRNGDNIEPLICKKCKYVPDGKESFAIIMNLLIANHEYLKLIELSELDEVIMYSHARSLMGTLATVQYTVSKYSK